MKQYEKNMYNFFRFFINFVSSYARYIHNKFMCTVYITILLTLSVSLLLYQVFRKVFSIKSSLTFLISNLITRVI
jgi:hypothetical protein